MATADHPRPLLLNFKAMKPPRGLGSSNSPATVHHACNGAAKQGRVAALFVICCANCHIYTVQHFKLGLVWLRWPRKKLLWPLHPLLQRPSPSAGCRSSSYFHLASPSLSNGRVNRGCRRSRGAGDRRFKCLCQNCYDNY